RLYQRALFGRYFRRQPFDERQKPVRRNANCTQTPRKPGRASTGVDNPAGLDDRRSVRTLDMQAPDVALAMKAMLHQTVLNPRASVSCGGNDHCVEAGPVE